MIRPLLALVRALTGRRGVRYVGGELPAKSEGDDVMFVLNPGEGEVSP